MRYHGNGSGGRQRRKWGLFGILLTALLLLGWQHSPPAGETPTEAPVGLGGIRPGAADGGTTKVDPPCLAQPSWVTAPEPFPAAMFPSDPSNCDFHQWAVQTFFWLTSKDEDGRLVFESFADPGDLFQPGGPDAPYPGHEDAQPQLRMLARVAKSQTTASKQEIFQAGPGGKALIDQNKEIVYYTNHLNQTYWDFIVAQRFYDLNKLQQDKDTNFAVGSMELKASWRVARRRHPDGSWGDWLIEDAEERFYVIETTIPAIGVNEKGQIYAKPDEQSAAKMALVGMHVVGVVAHHPEFVWATFEHVDNAPNYADTPTASGGPQGRWSFYAPNTPRDETNQFNINDPLAIVNVCLVHPQGGGNASNSNHIKQINASVSEILKNNPSQRPPWADNYYLGGTLWTNGDVPLNNGGFTQAQTQRADNPARQIGSVFLANTTMETFTQDDNCFACHNGGSHTVVVRDKIGNDVSTQINAKHINLSHFVVNYQATQEAEAKSNHPAPSSDDQAEETRR